MLLNSVLSAFYRPAYLLVFKEYNDFLSIKRLMVIEIETIDDELSLKIVIVVIYGVKPAYNKF